MKLYIFIIAIACAVTTFADAQRVADLTEARELMDSGKGDITAVLLHGSDWCTAGERVKTAAWDDSATSAALPPNIILCAVDHLEEFKPQEVLEHSVASLTPVSFDADDPVATNGTQFALQMDGSWLVKSDSPNPDYEVLSVTLQLESCANMLILSVLPDPSLPATGPGRASNGNMVVTEIELFAGENKQTLWATASYEQKGLQAFKICDNDYSNNNGWGIGAKHETHKLFLLPAAPLQPGVDIKLKIHCLHNSKKHTPGRFRIDAFDCAEAPALHKTGLTDLRNKVFAVSSGNYPSLSCLDEKGKRIGYSEPLPIDVTPKELAERVTEIIEIRDQWVALTNEAERAGSATKLEPYAKAWVLMHEAGAADYYKAAAKRILQLDPERKSPWTWRVSPDTSAIAKEEKRLIDVDDRSGAIEYINSMLKDDRLSQLTAKQRQEIVLRKFNIYRGWKENEDRRFEALREIVAIDPDTHIAIGAKGYIDMHGKGEPSMAFGWRPADLKVGEQQLTIKEGVPIQFDKPAHYIVTLSTRSSKKPVAIKSVTLLSGSIVLSRDTHEATLMRKADKENLYKLELPKDIDPDTLSLRIELDAPEGHEHHSNGIRVAPYIPADGPLGWR